jgi:predicted nucleic acid-binding protein
MTPLGLRFIDANLIMYAIGGPHPFRDACRNILRRINLNVAENPSNRPGGDTGEGL